jgi:hypothetical protein
MSGIEQQFLQYVQVELQFAAQSVAKYRDCLRQIRKVIGDRPVTAYGREDVLQLKSDMIARSLSVCRQVGILSALKRLLLFCRDELSLPVLESAATAIGRAFSTVAATGTSSTWAVSLKTSAPASSPSNV